MTLLIMKGPEVAFSDPTLEAVLLSDGLLKLWRVTWEPFEVWRRKFALATSLDATEVTEVLMQESEAHLARVAHFKTPAKGIQEFNFEEDAILPDLEDYVYYKKIIDPEMYSENQEIGFERVVANLETQVINGAATMKKVHEAVSQEFRSTCSLRSMLNTKIDETTSVVGTVPTNMNPRFLAPTVWGTIAEVASFLDSTERAGNATPKLTREQATHVQTLLVAFLENQIKPMMAQAKVGLIEETPFFVYAKNVKASMGVQTENLNHVRTRIEALEKRMTQDRTGFGPTPRAMSHSASTSAWLEAGVGIAPLASPAPNDVVPALSNRMDQAETNIRSLIAEGNAGAILFGGLGLRSVDETRSWATTNQAAADAFGLFPDCFSILEWIPSLNVGDNLAKLRTLKKLGIATLAEAKSMNGFDSILPRVFIGSGTPPMVVLKNESYLPAVKNFAYWSNQGAGMRSKLSDELKSIREGISNQIKLRLRPGTVGYNLATLALNLSVAWLESLLNFIDETYESLVRSGFTTGAAWGLATCLVMRIFEDISLVRAGVSSSFVMDDNMTNATTVLWATFQTHDVMSEYLTYKFKNHPSISSEYVKFLASNSGIEAVVKLTDGLKKMELDVRDAVSKLTSAVKKANSAGNKADEVKTKLASLEKRVLKLEQK